MRYDAFRCDGIDGMRFDAMGFAGIRFDAMGYDPMGAIVIAQGAAQDPLKSMRAPVGLAEAEALELAAAELASAAAMLVATEKRIVEQARERMSGRMSK